MHPSMKHTLLITGFDFILFFFLKKKNELFKFNLKFNIIYIEFHMI